MVSYRYIWVKAKRYYYYDTFPTWKKAMSIAKYYKQKHGSRYFVLKCEGGTFSPRIVFKLYMDKVTPMRLLGL